MKKLILIFSLLIISCADQTNSVPTETSVSTSTKTSTEQSSAGMPAYSSSWGLKKAVYDKAIAYMKGKTFKNARYVVVIDFSQHSNKKRFYLFDTTTSKLIEQHNAAHGSNSDKDNDGYAESFSNVSGSNQSSVGAYLTAETYSGKHGYSLRLDGKESTNSNARARAIVVHAADYVQDGVRAGRSWGCPALDPKVSKSVIDKIKGGALLYIGN